MALTTLSHQKQGNHFGLLEGLSCEVTTASQAEVNIIEAFPVSFSHSETGLTPAFKFITIEGTSTSFADGKFAALEYAFQYGDVKFFLLLFDRINWADHTVKDFEKIIKFSLELGLHSNARRLAEIAKKQFPENPIVKKYASILAPSKTINNHLPSDPDSAADMIWLKDHGREFHGRWVALIGGDLIASAPNYKELINLLQEPIKKEILITPVY